jgi:predicted DNA repair protein MutK
LGDLGCLLTAIAS